MSMSDDYMNHEERAPMLNRYGVKVTGSKRRVIVNAEYYRIGDRGELIFRISVPKSYPITVHVFAHGHWLDVQHLPPEGDQ